ncbi:zinc finger CCHC domain-containing protein 8 homolog isoform X2 [Macrosteles quadrilineatus]|uniref:zinc finger CCHC domain-containing protein 8 homolog isoform X2 n=1 Tax=Macrosteles quadrilineatus TaxID=74068 RepID=UPI0023E1D80D|nr:zinc finger CCHC domain-containing protein 8 homolog isoform X2 [Macrosteles quadrilineatus]
MEDREKSSEEEDGEILFFEDRTPGNASSKHISSKAKHSESENFLRFESTAQESPLSPDETPMSPADSDRGSRPVSVNRDETDSRPTKSKLIGNSDEGGTVEDILFVEEDRNPILTGQETCSPRYYINANFMSKNDDNSSIQKKNKFANTCWNCDETTHSLRDCPEPRNHVKISRSRQEFQKSRGPQVIYKRYHVEESQVFGHLVPGQISKGLRKALGLEKRQIPLHIYNMRRLGYPPGWLLEAKVSHSGISMFDGQGREVNDPDTEVGEVVEEGSKDKYDIRKIVHYPGFNVPPPPGFYDDSGYWGCPPQSQRQSVEVMLTRLEGKIAGGYKRKKLSLNATASDVDDTSQSAESHDMEYEETPGHELPEDHCKFIPPLPDEDLPAPPPCDLPEAETVVDETSLAELEDAKKQLLAQLNDTSPICGTPESRVGKVKSVDMGTPLLQSVSPYQRLPSADKFSVNICDVINFENLPDSTGKYKKMSGLIRKVRVKLSKINDEP